MEYPAEAPISRRSDRLVRRWVNAVRVFFLLLTALLVAVLIDGWTRVLILPWYRFRKDEQGHIEVFNRLLKTWGIATMRLNIFYLGLRIVIQGELPKSGRFIVVANHQSSLDIPAMILALPGLNLKFVAKEELGKGSPAVSLGLRNGGHAFLAKKSLGEDLAILQTFAAGLEKHDGSPVVFPEGIRTFDGEILPFHMAGTETIRRKCNLPLIPVTIDGLWEARTIWEYARLIDHTVTVHIGDPISSEQFGTDPRESGKQLEQTIRSRLADIRQRNGS